MADKPIAVYLNDHLAGATFGSDLASQIVSQSDDSEAVRTLSAVASEIEADRETLIGLMERMSVARNPLKQATTWLAEKASRVKLSGLSSGEDQLGLFLALESLSLGIEGKASLWAALGTVTDRYPELATLDFSDLEARARKQRQIVEGVRITASRHAFTGPDSDDG